MTNFLSRRFPPVFFGVPKFNLILMLAFCATPAIGQDTGPPNRPNVLIVLVDDMGYGDSPSFNPQSKIRTPNIDRLAREGMKLTDAHAPGPLCHMSRYGLVTGRYPFRTNVNRWPTEPLIDAGQVTIASHLKSAGYRTSMVGKWHLGFAENGYDQPLPGGPVEVGFDQFFGIRASTDIPPYFYIRDDRAVMPPSETIEANATAGWSPIQGEFWRAGGIAPDLALANVLPRFTEEAVSQIKAAGSSTDEVEPWMLYVAFPAPHTPWLPSEEFAGKSEVGLYGDFLMMVDAMIGRILDQLDESGMGDDTLVLLTSDNGPVWYDVDRQKYDHDSCGGWRGMKGDAWEAGHRMPMIARWPGQIAAGSQSDQMICFTDVLATLADITQTKLPDNVMVDSISFLPALLAKSPIDSSSMREQMVLMSGRGALSVRDGDWKYINALGSNGFTKPSRVVPTPGGPTGQLYDLSSDPGETNNVAMKWPERVSKMESILKRHLSEGTVRE